MKRFALFVGVFFLVSFGSFAAELSPEMKAYYTVGSSELTLIEDQVYDSKWVIPGLERNAADAVVAPKSPIAEAEVILDQIVNLGKKIWSIVEANKPVVSFKNQTASALPKGVESWLDLDSWDNARAQTYRLVYKNLYGMTVVEFAYRIVYVAGGSYQGKGKYLAQITVYPETVDVAWGYKFSAEASIPTLLNHGTREAPVAGAEINVDWVIETPLKYSRNTTSYAVRGDGPMIALQ
jgi:hypothetical protein